MGQSDANAVVVSAVTDPVFRASLAQTFDETVFRHGVDLSATE